MNNVKEFLKEYNELTGKYNLDIETLHDSGIGIFKRREIRPLSGGGFFICEIEFNKEGLWEESK